MSPKNKGTHGKGAQPAHEPDEFVQTVHSLSDRLLPHVWKFVAVGVLLLLALSVWKVLDWRHNKKAKSATSAYFSAMKIVDAPIVGADDVKPAVETLSFASEEERGKASLAALSSLSKKHDDIALAKLANLHEAKLMLKAGRYDEAQAMYQKFAASKAPEPLRLTALEGVGYSLEAKAMANEDASARQTGLQAALQAFEQLQPNKDGSMRDYSLYHQGRILIAMGKVDEGIAKFKELTAEQPDSELTVSVENRLASLGAE